MLLVTMSFIQLSLWQRSVRKASSVCPTQDCECLGDRQYGNAASPDKGRIPNKMKKSNRVRIDQKRKTENLQEWQSQITVDPRFQRNFDFYNKYLH